MYTASAASQMFLVETQIQKCLHIFHPVRHGALQCLQLCKSHRESSRDFTCCWASTAFNKEQHWESLICLLLTSPEIMVRLPAPKPQNYSHCWDLLEISSHRFRERQDFLKLGASKLISCRTLNCNHQHQLLSVVRLGLGSGTETQMMTFGLEVAWERLQPLNMWVVITAYPQHLQQFLVHRPWSHFLTCKTQIALHCWGVGSD